MGRAHFGTDGVRGVANVDLTAELALALGRATARVLKSSGFVVGRDTRRSGPLLQGAFSAGLATEGVTVSDVGVLPTPALALLARGRGVPAAVVSASHNPFQDNGIKLFSSEGTKLPVETEQAIEEELDALLGSPEHATAPPRGAGVGVIVSDAKAVDEYRQGVVRALKGRRLDGLHVVLDCANGAASTVAPAIFDSLGARVDAVFDQPDGININDGCGSTHPAALSAAVLERGAALGLAFDGDADRLVAVDHRGVLADGDTLLALFAIDLANRGLLPGDSVVVTVMSNLGFRHAMSERNIAVVETPVGDRSVLEALEAGGFHLGGEQSGHIVFRQLTSTGDGILTGLLLADLIVRSGVGLAALSAGLIERVPQVLRNVTVLEPHRLAGATEVWKAVSEVEASLGSTGRVLLRASGTEPVIRVMVETFDPAAAESAVDRLCAAVEGSLGTPTVSA
ncbi:MAG TPA: phosphoglucosamine mutase [Acidimicrobiales bacterium]|nr:phosphoglucosamine mutase [Acidimicrobiales bacterium]